MEPFKALGLKEWQELVHSLVEGKYRSHATLSYLNHTLPYEEWTLQRPSQHIREPSHYGAYVGFTNNMIPLLVQLLYIIMITSVSFPCLCKTKRLNLLILLAKLKPWKKWSNLKFLVHNNSFLVNLTGESIQNCQTFLHK